MKYLRVLPLCLSVLALPLIMTGCKPAGDDASTTATDTNAAAAAPAAADTNAPAAAPAAADTNAPAATTNAPSGT